MLVKSAIKMICSEKSDPEKLFRRRHARESRNEKSKLRSSGDAKMTAGKAR